MLKRVQSENAINKIQKTNDSNEKNDKSTLEATIFDTLRPSETLSFPTYGQSQSAFEIAGPAHSK